MSELMLPDIVLKTAITVLKVIVLNKNTKFNENYTHTHKPTDTPTHPPTHTTII